MIPDPEGRDEGPAEITPPFALMLTIGASLLTTMIAVTFVSAGGVTPARLGFAMLVGFGAMFAIAAPRIPEPPAVSLGFVAPAARAWRAVLLLIPAILLVSEVDNLIRALVPFPETGEPEERGALDALELALVGIVVSPVIAETFFRGMIQPRLVDTWGELRGVGACAVLASLPSFSLLGIWGFGPALVQSVLLGILRARSGSLLPGLALGAVYGAIGVLANFGVFGIGGFDDLSESHTSPVWLVFAGATTFLGLRIGLDLRPRPTDDPPPAA